MASVTPRTLQDGTVRWRVQYRIDGQMQQTTFDNADGAEEYGRLVDRVGGAAAQKVLSARRSKRSDVPTLRNFTSTYLDPHSGMLTGIEAGTRKDYKGAAERSFLQILGDYPVDTIQKSDVGRWLAWQESQPSARRNGRKVAAKTVKNYHALLSNVLAAVVESKLRPDNPAYRTRLSRGMKREGVFLSVEEFATLLHFIPTRHQGLVLFLAGTGCRWGEATAITWADLILTVTPVTVRIDKAWKKAESGGPVLGHPKSSKSRRTVSLPADVVDALGKPGAAQDLVFPSTVGKHLWYARFRTSHWEKAVDKAMDRALCESNGLTPLSRRPSIHDLRHTHASWLIAAGAPLPYIQARLGHESITTTVGTYGHLVPDAGRQLAEIVGHTLAGVRSLRPDAKTLPTGS